MPGGVANRIRVDFTRTETVQKSLREATGDL